MTRLTVFGLFLMCCLGCEHPLDLTLDLRPSKLVVISNFTAESDLLVRVTNSQPIVGSTTPVFITDAVVEVFQEETFIQQLSLVDLGGDSYYTTRNFRPLPGFIYTIKVSAPGFEDVEGQSRIPDRVDILQLRVTDYDRSQEAKGNWSQINYVLSLQFEDPEGEQNFYHLSLYQEFAEYQVVGADTVVQGIDRRPILFDPGNNTNVQVVHYNGSILFEDAQFDGHIQGLSVPVNLRYNSSQEKPGAVVVELRSVTEEYYLFHTSLSRQQQTPEQPYVDPVILFNNIRNGHGIFAGYSTSSSSVELE